MTNPASFMIPITSARALALASHSFIFPLGRTRESTGRYPFHSGNVRYARYSFIRCFDRNIRVDRRAQQIHEGTRPLSFETIRMEKALKEHPNCFLNNESRLRIDPVE